jgi:predicted kinase
MIKKCIMLIGLPGTGKSTFYGKNFEYEYDIISTDYIIQNFADSYSMTYNDVFPDLIKLAEKVMWNSIESGCSECIDMCIDRTNLTKNSRKKFLDYFRLEGYVVTAYVFGIPEDWGDRLNSRPGKIIPKHVLRSMQENYEEPSLDEGFVEIITVGI